MFKATKFNKSNLKKEQPTHYKLNNKLSLKNLEKILKMSVKTQRFNLPKQKSQLSNFCA